MARFLHARLLAARTLLEGSSADSRSGVSSVQANAFISALQKTQLTAEQRNALLEATLKVKFENNDLGRIVAEIDSSAGAAPKRRLGSLLHPMIINYFTQTEWDVMLDAEVANMQVLELILNRVYLLGAKVVNEESSKYIASIWQCAINPPWESLSRGLKAPVAQNSPELS